VPYLSKIFKIDFGKVRFCWKILKLLPPLALDFGRFFGAKQ